MEFQLQAKRGPSLANNFEGGPPSKLFCATSGGLTSNLSNLSSTLSTTRTSILPPSVSTKPQPFAFTTNRLLQSSSLIHQNKSDFLKETNAATKKRDQLFSSLLSEKPNLSNRLLLTGLHSGTSVNKSTLASNIEVKPQSTFQSAIHSDVLKQQDATVKESNISSTFASSPASVPQKSFEKSQLIPTENLPASFMFKESQSFPDHHHSKCALIEDDPSEAIIEFARFEEEHLEETFGWKKLSSADNEEHLRLVRDKECLLFEAAVSLVGNPKLQNPTDPTRMRLLKAAEVVADRDPEFILKVSLYCRQELNLRTTTNLLLAFASLHPGCKIHLQRYFKNSVQLPTDWTAIADFIQTFKQLPTGSLPSVLRRAMVTKFKDFDEYQLAKHNKGKKLKKREPGDPMDVDILPVDDEEEIRHDEAMRGRGFNLKRLIRVLHISEPVYHVLCLLGKKYPENELEFLSTRFPGTFDPRRAGKRLKLPTPETWETQVTKLGNKASVWHDLIDHKKLPYMAMIRNLRNLVLAGIDEAHIQKICKYITNEKAVAGSRLFPFRFYTAFDVLEDLDKFSASNFGIKLKKKTNPKNPKSPKNSKNVANTQLAKESQAEIKKWERLMKKQSTMNTKAIALFRKALEKAVHIATVKNVPPIQGVTLIFCASGYEMLQDLGAKSNAKNIFQKQTQLIHAALLVSFMAHSASENAELWTYNATNAELVPRFEEAKANDNEKSLLGRAKQVTSKLSWGNVGNSSVAKILLHPDLIQPGVLMKYLREHHWIDTILWIHGVKQVGDTAKLDDWMEQYRQLVNPNLAFISVDVDGSGKRSEEDFLTRHPKDLRLSGFSEQIFHCLSSSGTQVDEVENIDKKFKLPVNTSFTEDRALPDPIANLISGTVHWRTIKVFISSTFMDMHGERDLLNRFVFPELVRRGRQLCIDIIPIDLRWGLPNFGSENDTELWATRQVRACIDEIDKCHYFIGFLGKRYGWKPPFENLRQSRHNESRSLAEKIGHVYKAGMSITELEMEYAALSDSSDSKKDRVFFFIRDHSGLDSSLPTDIKRQFNPESKEDEQKLENLKEKILQSGYEVVNGYPATFRGIVRGQPMSGNLSSMGQRVLDMLWNSMKKFDEASEENLTQREKHEAIASKQAESFVSRQKLLDNIVSAINTTEGGIINLSGAPGSGATSLMGKAYKVLNNMQKANKKFTNIVVPIFADAVNVGDEQEVSLLNYILLELMTSLGLVNANTDSRTMNSRSLCTNIANILQSARDIMLNPNTKVIIFLDGLESLKLKSDSNSSKKNAVSLNWLPPQLPAGVVLLVSTHHASKWDKFFHSRADTKVYLKISQLDMFERKEILRSFLSAFGKALDERAFNNDLTQLATKKESGNVQFLKLVASEMVSFGFFEELSSQLVSVGETSELFLNQILYKLDSDFGEELVSGVLGVLYNSQNQGGIPEMYLNQTMNLLYSKATALQVSILLNSLDAFLVRRGDLISLKEREFSTCVEMRYLKTNLNRITHIQTILGDTFLLLYRDQHLTGGVDSYIIKALPFHLASCSRIKELEEVICSLSFLFHSAVAGVLQSTKTNLSGGFFPSKVAQSRFLSLDSTIAYGEFLAKHEDKLSSQPCLILQLGLNEVEGSLIHKEAQIAVKSKKNSILVKSAQTLIICENQEHQGDAQILYQREFKTSSNLITSAIETSPSIEPQSLLAAHGFSDGSILITLANTNDDLFSFIGHSSPITALVFLPGSKSSGDAFLVSGSKDGFISFWDLTTRIRLSSVKGHTKKITGLATSLDGLTLVSVAYDGILKVWGGRTRKENSEIKQESPFTCVAHHPDKDYVITGDFDGLIKIWDLTKVEKRAVLRGHQSAVQCVTLSWDAKNVLTSSITGDIIVFDGSTGSQRAKLSTGQSVTSISFISGDEGTVLAGCRDGKILRWNFASSSPIGRVPIPEQKPVTSVCIFEAFSIALGTDDGELIILRKNKNKCIFKICNQTITSITSRKKEVPKATDVVQTWNDMIEEEPLPMDEYTIFFISTNNSLFLLAFLTSNEFKLSLFCELDGISGQVLGFSMVGSSLVIGTSNGQVYVKPVKTFHHKIASIDEPKMVLCKAVSTAHRTGMSAIATHPIKDWCMTSGDNMIKLWRIDHDAKKLLLLSSLELDETVNSLAFITQYGKTYIMGSSSSKIYLNRVSDTEEPDKSAITIVPKGDTDISMGEIELIGASGSSESSEVIACLDMNGLTICSNKGAELRRFEGRFGNAISLAHIKHNNDSYQLALCDNKKGEIIIYDVLQGEVDITSQLTGFKRSVNLVTNMENDRSKVFGSSQDKTLKIWKVPESSAPCSKPMSQVISLANCGENVFALSEDGTLEVWTQDEDEKIKKIFLGQLGCTRDHKNENMTSLSVILAPALKELFNSDDVMEHDGDDENGSVYILATTCSKHSRVHLWSYTDGKLLRLIVRMKNENPALTVNNFKTKSPPLSSTMCIQQLDTQKPLLILAVGTESGHVREIHIKLTKDMSTTISQESIIIIVESLRHSEVLLAGIRISKVFPYQPENQLVAAVGFAGKGVCSFEVKKEDWYTSWVSLTLSKTYHILGDVRGQIHVYTQIKAKGDPKYKKILEARLHHEGITSLDIIDKGKILATASSDGSVRLWKVNADAGGFGFKQVGEFTGRGLPFTTMATFNMKIRSDREGKQRDQVEMEQQQPCILVSDKIGTYVLSVRDTE